MKEAILDDIQVSFKFDQSPYVTRATHTVVVDGLLDVLLTGLMFFLFLHDWRSVIVVLNISFALIAAVVALWLTGQSINLMTLGGLALAVGILVDEATLDVENIHSQFEHTPSIARALLLGNAQTAVPRLLADAVHFGGLPAVVLHAGSGPGPVRAAVAGSRVGDDFLVHTSCQAHSFPSRRSGSVFNRLRERYARVVAIAVHLRWLLLPAYLVITAAVIALAGSRIGQDNFPRVDAGQFQLRLRPGM